MIACYNLPLGLSNEEAKEMIATIESNNGKKRYYTLNRAMQALAHNEICYVAKVVEGTVTIYEKH